MEGHLLMSRQELERKTVLEEVKSGRRTLVSACSLLGVSYRHVRLLYKAFCARGDVALVHAARGRSSNRGHEAACIARVTLEPEQVFDFMRSIGIPFAALTHPDELWEISKTSTTNPSQEQSDQALTG